MSPDVAEQVATLLAASKVAHGRYRSFKPRFVSGTVQHGDDKQATDAVLHALHAREQAHALDPEHTAPAWKGETQHDELLTFYRSVLAR